MRDEVPKITPFSPVPDKDEDWETPKTRKGGSMVSFVLNTLTLSALKKTLLLVSRVTEGHQKKTEVWKR